MKYHPYLIFAIFVFSITSGTAQSRFRKGFIITIQKDTVHGEIDYRSNTKNYRTCRFKSKGTLTEYTPSQILGYRFYNDKYFTSQVLDDSFVEVLIDGDLSLFKHEEGYSIQKSGGEINNLEFQKAVAEEEGNKKVKEDTRWKGIISYLTQDCEKNEQLMQGLKPDEKSLTDFVINYHKCKGTGFTYYKSRKTGPNMEFGFITGLTQSSMKIRGLFNVMGHLADHYTSINPYFGLIFAASFPEFSERIVLQSELHLIKTNYSSSIVLDKFLKTEYHNAFIDVLTMSIPFSLKYSLSEKKYPLFFQLGFSYDKNLKTDSKLISQWAYQYPDTVVTKESLAFEINRSQVGLIGGIGAEKSFKKFKGAITIRYHPALKTNLSVEATKIDKFSFSLIFLTN